MKIDIDLNKITDLSADVKNTLLQNKREIALLNKKLAVRDKKIEDLQRELYEKEDEMKVRHKMVRSRYNYHVCDPNYTQDCAFAVMEWKRTTCKKCLKKRKK